MCGSGTVIVYLWHNQLIYSVRPVLGVLKRGLERTLSAGDFWDDG